MSCLIVFWRIPRFPTSLWSIFLRYKCGFIDSTDSRNRSLGLMFVWEKQTSSESFCQTKQSSGELMTVVNIYTFISHLLLTRGPRFACSLSALLIYSSHRMAWRTFKSARPRIPLCTVVWFYNGTMIYHFRVLNGWLALFQLHGEHLSRRRVLTLKWTLEKASSPFLCYFTFWVTLPKSDVFYIMCGRLLSLEKT